MGRRKRVPKINQEEYERLKRDIEDEIHSWDGAESGWGDDATDNVLTLIDKFFLGDEMNVEN